jgi:hypothetical protein
LRIFRLLVHDAPPTPSTAACAHATTDGGRGKVTLIATRPTYLPTIASSAPARPSARRAHRRGGQRWPPRARAAVRSRRHKPDSLKSVDAVARKPWDVTSSWAYRMCRSAAFSVFSETSRSEVRTDRKAISLGPLPPSWLMRQ